MDIIFKPAAVQQLFNLKIQFAFMQKERYKKKQTIIIKNLQNATLAMHMLNSNQNLIYYNPNLWYDVYFSFEKEWNCYVVCQKIYTSYSEL